MNLTNWQQWDKQEEKRINAIQRKKVGNLIFVMLNNLYLKMELGKLPINRKNGNQLLVWLDKLYPTHKLEPGSFEILMTNNIRESWLASFESLPDWNAW